MAGFNIHNSKEGKIGGGGVGFAFAIGRGSKGCQGFGICRLVAVWIVIVWNDKDSSEYPFTGLITTNNEDESKYSAYVTLKQSIDDTQYDTTFYVDEDIQVNSDQGNYIIKAGVYQLDKSLGNYGGYALDVQKL